jgi:hypothetical protein
MGFHKILSFECIFLITVEIKVCMHICMWAHTHTYIYIHVVTHTHIYIYMWAHTHTDIYIYMWAHTHTYIYMLAYISIDIHTYLKVFLWNWYGVIKLAFTLYLQTVRTLKHWGFGLD